MTRHRLFHVYGISKSPAFTWFRALGVVLTLSVILISSLLLIWHFLILRTAAL